MHMELDVNKRSDCTRIIFGILPKSGGPLRECRKVETINQIRKDQKGQLVTKCVCEKLPRQVWDLWDKTVRLCKEGSYILSNQNQVWSPHQKHIIKKKVCDTLQVSEVEWQGWVMLHI